MSVERQPEIWSGIIGLLKRSNLVANNLVLVIHSPHIPSEGTRGEVHALEDHRDLQDCMAMASSFDVEAWREADQEILIPLSHPEQVVATPLQSLGAPLLQSH